MTEKKTKFTKIWEKEFDLPEEGLKRVVKITTVNKDDFKKERETDFWKEKVYKFKIAVVDWIKDAELAVNKNDRALWKLIIWDKEYVLWRSKNEEDEVYIFKLDDEYWVRVTETVDINKNPVYKIKLSYKYDPEEVIDESDVENDEPF